VTGSGGKTIAVVGASASIGEAVVRALLARKHRVLATHRATPPDVHAPGLTHHRLDLMDSRDQDRFVAGPLAEAGSLDGVVLLAGLLPGKALAEYDDALMDQVMGVNFTAQAKLLRRLEGLLADPSHVVMMASVSGERGSYDPLYAAAKGAVIAFVKSLATWMAPATRVNALAPGLIAESTMARDMAPERREHHRQQAPVKRLLTPDALGGIVADLFEPHWDHLNGVTLRLNGGAHV
jgi:3-oxoacyl-[acyl-carrier protein] reductase